MFTVAAIKTVIHQEVTSLLLRHDVTVVTPLQKIVKQSYTPSLNRN